MAFSNKNTLTEDLSATFVLNAAQSVKMEEVILTEELKSKCLFPRATSVGLISLITVNFTLDLQG